MNVETDSFKLICFKGFSFFELKRIVNAIENLGYDATYDNGDIVFVKIPVVEERTGGY